MNFHRTHNLPSCLRRNYRTKTDKVTPTHPSTGTKTLYVWFYKSPLSRNLSGEGEFTESVCLKKHDVNWWDIRHYRNFKKKFFWFENFFLTFIFLMVHLDQERTKNLYLVKGEFYMIRITPIKLRSEWYGLVFDIVTVSITLFDHRPLPPLMKVRGYYSLFVQKKNKNWGSVCFFYLCEFFVRPHPFRLFFIFYFIFI